MSYDFDKWNERTQMAARLLGYDPEWKPFSSIAEADEVANGMFEWNAIPTAQVKMLVKRTVNTRIAAAIEANFIVTADFEGDSLSRLKVSKDMGEFLHLGRDELIQTSYGRKTPYGVACCVRNILTEWRKDR